jgi:hypothetical protein
MKTRKPLPPQPLGAKELDTAFKAAKVLATHVIGNKEIKLTFNYVTKTWGIKVMTLQEKLEFPEGFFEALDYFNLMIEEEYK